MEREFEILIVEDDVELALNLQGILEEKGYPVAVAHNGQTALALFREKIFDLALIDIRLPDMSGEELIDQLTALSPRTEYIINTGYASLDGAVEAVRKKNIIAYEIKPIDIDRLVSFVDQVAKRKRAEEGLKQASEEWKRTFDAISDLIFIQDGDFRLTQVNKAVCDVLRVTPNDLIGKKCHEVLHKSDKPWPNCPTAKTLKDKKPHTEEVYDLNIGIPLLIGTSPIFNEKGEIAGIVHVVKDITELKRMEEEREKLIRELQKTLSEVKTLKGIFPICASCKKIRDDKGYWNQVKVYIRDHSEAEFSHGICPECMKKLYPDFALCYD